MREYLSGRSPKESTMADEAENTQPEDQPHPPQTPDAPDAAAGAADSGGDSGAEEAVEEASAIADDVAAQADEGADMTDDEAAALAAAMSAIKQVNDGTAVAGATTDAATGAGTEIGADEGAAFEPPELDDGEVSGDRSDLDLLSDVQMNVRIELGRTRMFVEDVLRLGDGAVVELDKLAGDPVDVYVNDRKVARGEVLVLNDNFCVRISEILDVRESG